MNDVSVNIVEWYTYYSTHRNQEKRKKILNKIFFFLNRKKILASWCFANQPGIVWGTSADSKNKKNRFFGQNSPYPPFKVEVYQRDFKPFNVQTLVYELEFFNKNLSQRDSEKPNERYWDERFEFIYFLPIDISTSSAYRYKRRLSPRSPNKKLQEICIRWTFEISATYPFRHFFLVALLTCSF